MNIIKIIKDWYIPKTNNKSYSELSNTFKLKEDINDEDMIQMSHKRSCDGLYETVIVPVKKIREYLIDEILKEINNRTV